MKTTPLALDHVRLVYPDGDSTLTVLDHVSLRVAGGELVALVGPSGSGKSSLLAVAGLLQRPTAGAVHVVGTEAGALSDAERTALRRRLYGFVFQQSNLIPSLTALEQLELMSHIDGGRPADARARARDLLAAVGLGDKAARRPHQLSGGERQRVGIARALVNQPSVLLADEPTSALDHDRAAGVVALLARLTRELDVATIMVTHDTRNLDAADRVVSIEDGALFEANSTGLGALQDPNLVLGAPRAT